jgi:hypothetical protein
MLSYLSNSLGTSTLMATLLKLGLELNLQDLKTFHLYILSAVHAYIYITFKSSTT